MMQIQYYCKINRAIVTQILLLLVDSDGVNRVYTKFSRDNLEHAAPSQALKLNSAAFDYFSSRKHVLHMGFIDLSYDSHQVYSSSQLKISFVHNSFHKTSNQIPYPFAMAKNALL